MKVFHKKRFFLKDGFPKDGPHLVSIFEIQPLALLCLVKRFHFCCNTMREQINCEKRRGGDWVPALQSDNMVIRCENPDGWDPCMM